MFGGAEHNALLTACGPATGAPKRAHGAAAPFCALPERGMPQIDIYEVPLFGAGGEGEVGSAAHPGLRSLVSDPDISNCALR